MKVVDASINEVYPYAKNPRHNKNAVGKVAASIKEFGWRQPIVVDSKMMVIVKRWENFTGKKASLEG